MIEFIRGCANASEDGRDAGVGEGLAEPGGKLGVPVPDQVRDHRAGIFEVHDQVPGELSDPVRGGVGGGAEDADAASRVLDDSKDVLALTGQRNGLDEVAGQERVSLGAQEGGPTGGAPIGCGIDALGLEDLPHGRGGNLETQSGEFAVDAAIAPGRVLLSQTQRQSPDGTEGARASMALVPGDGRVASAEQVAVPAQDGVRPYQQVQPAQCLAGQRGQECGEEGSIRGGEPHLPVAELALQDGDLVAQREDLGVLVAIACR